MTERYWMDPRLGHYLIYDHRGASYPVVTCPDREMAQRIVDLLNEEEDVKEMGRRQATEEKTP